MKRSALPITFIAFFSILHFACSNDSPQVVQLKQDMQNSSATESRQKTQKNSTKTSTGSTSTTDNETCDANSYVCKDFSLIEKLLCDLSSTEEVCSSNKWPKNLYSTNILPNLCKTLTINGKSSVNFRTTTDSNSTENTIGDPFTSQDTFGKIRETSTLCESKNWLEVINEAGESGFVCGDYVTCGQ